MAKTEMLNALIIKTKELADYSNSMQMATQYKSKDKYNYLAVIFIANEAKKELEKIEKEKWRGSNEERVY